MGAFKILRLLPEIPSIFDEEWCKLPKYSSKGSVSSIAGPHKRLKFNSEKKNQSNGWQTKLFDLNTAQPESAIFFS